MKDQRIQKMNVAELPGIKVEDMKEHGKVKVLVIENDRCTAFTLPEHGETVIVTSRGNGYKVKFHEEHLL